MYRHLPNGQDGTSYMSLSQYHSRDQDRVRITPQQASGFAKEVAGDFNPIHDPGAKRFCVPGDLLFALVLSRYGISQHMRFRFAGMVGDGVQLLFPPSDAALLTIRDELGKEYLHIERDGALNQDAGLIDGLTRGYVSFSGQTFPHILVPLMEEQQIMINPDRPLVIYESMAIDLDRLDITEPQLELSNARLNVDGKRGDVRLAFRISSAGEVVGHGEKSMLLSGLRAFDAAQMQQLVDDYATRKTSYGQR